MQLINPRLRITLFVLMLCFSIGVLSFFLVFGAALHQEKDTPDILKAILTMELTRANVVQVNSNSNRLLLKTISSLNTYLEKQEWIWKDQLGGVVIDLSENLQTTPSLALEGVSTKPLPDVIIRV